MAIAAVSFDGDGTLWDFDAVMRRALGIVLDHIRRDHPGPAADAMTVEDMIRVRDQVAAAHGRDWSALEDIRRESFAVTLARLGVPDREAADGLNALYLHHRFADIELFPDVLPCLEEVAASHTIGLLSNGNSYPERCGLDGRLEFVVFAEAHGVAKPDPAIFRIAAAQAGCDPADMVHVGDGEADVVGARRAGCWSVLLDRSGAAPAFAGLADAVIPGLAALPAVLTQLSVEG